MLKNYRKPQATEVSAPPLRTAGPPDCIAEGFGTDTARIIQFTADDGRVHGLPASQLIHYVLEKNASAGDDASAPPDRLTLLFSMHNVVLTGWRLNELLKSLEAAKPVTVTPGNVRYANIRQNDSFVTSIRVDLASHSPR